MANLKFTYMDHWYVPTQRGLAEYYDSKSCFDRYCKALVGVGYQGLDIFQGRRGLVNLFGSLKKAEEFAQDRGIERFVNTFGGGRNAHIREAQDAGIKSFEAGLKTFEGIKIDNWVVCPGDRYYDVEPVTDEKLHNIADYWNRIGKMLASHGINLACHHEFFTATSRAEELEKFYSWTDPQYVKFCLDTAQHTIAGLDPVALYVKYHDRTTAFHMKDTHHVDKRGDYRIPPDPEKGAATTERWFWEMGTPEGLVNWPQLWTAMKGCKYTGWVGIEHDKCEMKGANYQDSTCRGKWYIDNVLSKIYA